MHTEKYTQQIPGRPCMKSKDLLPKKKKDSKRGKKSNKYTRTVEKIF